MVGLFLDKLHAFMLMPLDNSHLHLHYVGLFLDNSQYHIQNMGLYFDKSESQFIVHGFMSSVLSGFHCLLIT